MLSSANKLFGVGDITTDEGTVKGVPLSFDFRTCELGYQNAAKSGIFRENTCFEKLATVTGRFASPWGNFVLQPEHQWTSFSTGGGGWTMGSTPLWSLVDGAIDWSYWRLHSNSPVKFEAPFETDEVLFVGKSRNLLDAIDLGDDLRAIFRKNSVSVIGEVDEAEIYPLFATALSIANGHPLRVHSHQLGRDITFYGNKYEPSDKTSQSLAFLGFPFVSPEKERVELAEVAQLAMAKLKSVIHSSASEGPGQLEVLQYLSVRCSKSYTEVKSLAAFAFLETFCEKHLKKADYPRLFGVTHAEAEALNRYRNDLVHNNLDPSGATRDFDARLRRSDSALYKAMRDDVVSNPSTAAVTYILSLCDHALLKWIGYEGLTQMFIPTSEGALRKWQGCEC